MTAPVSATDRRDPSPDSGVGIDTLAIVGPTAASTLYELDRISHGRFVDHRTGEVVDHGHSGSHSITVGGAPVMVWAWQGESGAEMRLQTSVPRLLRGHNWDGVGVHELSGGVELLLTSVAEELPDVPCADDVRITRMDLTRDFLDVRNPSATLTAIARHPVPWSTVNQLYLRADGKLQTLMRGNKTQWVARGYDKSHEAMQGSGLQRELARVRPRQLRFEVEMKSKELRRQRVTSVSDLLAVDLTELTRHYFERCKFDVNTAQTGWPDLVEALAMDGVTPAQRRNLLVYLMNAELGGPQLLSRGPFDEARALANRYKLARGSLGASTFTRRWDFENAREVVD